MGPIDGHDFRAVKQALLAAKEAATPIVLHVATIKGKGFAPAEQHPSKWHGVAPWVEPSSATPLSEQKTATQPLSISLITSPVMPAIRIDISSKRPRLPGGFASSACLASAFAIAALSAGLIDSIVSKTICS
jgi:1-deoxy-D-xylulose-5-phosphate synthase